MTKTFILRLCIGVAGISTVVACSANSGDKQTSVSEAPSPTSKVAQRPPLKVRAQPTLIAPYALPTLEEFSRHRFVAAVIEGDVTDSVTDVRDAQDSVGTTLTIAVSRGWGVSGSTIIATEYGGIIPLRRVRSSFEGKEWQQPLTEMDLNRKVEYRMECFPPTHIGDHVVLFLARREDGSLALAAKLLRTNGVYGWAEGESPNEGWAKQYSAAEIDGFVTARS